MKCETTLFVPTHNRPNQFKRLLRFVDRLGTKVRVVVADSSGDEYHAANRCTIASCQLRGNITLLDFRGSPVVDKYLKGLDLVDTDTVCICGDDDLVFVDQVIDCSRFLKMHPEYSYARGRMVTFVDSAERDLRSSLRAYDQRDISMGDPIDRIRYHLQHYRSNFYSVRRTKSIVRNLAIALKLDAGVGLQERLIPILDLLDGKGALLDGLFMGRQIGQSMLDERGARTVPGKRLEGSAYAESLTRNSEDYLNLIAREVRARCPEVPENRIVGLRKALRADIDAYFVEKARPGRLSFAKLRSKLLSRAAEFRRRRLDGAYSSSVEALLAHVLRHRPGT